MMINHMTFGIVTGQTLILHVSRPDQVEDEPVCVNKSDLNEKCLSFLPVLLSFIQFGNNLIGL